MEDDKQPLNPIREHIKCPNCGSTNAVVKNLDEVWRDGDLCCADCGTKIRDWDAL